ncbi:MAG: hypothetical protein HYR51_06235 [Candidatus Rokubacteria bacterium]|nr:hypothetical protein [Candidatus Rokubacteria bacterium]
MTTIENNMPFLACVQELGGLEGPGAKSEIAVCTAGFPSPVLVDSPAALAHRGSGVAFQHWGDADLGFASGGCCARSRRSGRGGRGRACR